MRKNKTFIWRISTIALVTISMLNISLAQNNNNCQITYATLAPGGGGGAELQYTTYGNNNTYIMPMQQYAEGEKNDSVSHSVAFTLNCGGSSLQERQDNLQLSILTSNMPSATPSLSLLAPIQFIEMGVKVRGSMRGFQTGNRWEQERTMNLVTGSVSGGNVSGPRYKVEDSVTIGLWISSNKINYLVSNVVTAVPDIGPFQVARVTRTGVKPATQTFDVIFRFKPIKDPCMIAPPLKIKMPTRSVIFRHPTYVTQKENSQPFTITVSRDSRVSGCVRQIQPSITYKPEDKLLNKESIDLENGFSLSIKNSATGQFIEFNKATDTAPLLEGQDTLDMQFQAVVRQNKEQEIKRGKFSTLVRYVIEYR